jgi:hypothetical protein
MQIFDSLKYAPLEEVWSPVGQRIAPRIENPYAPQHDIIDKATSPTIENRCQQYLEDLYASQGVDGLLGVMQPVMVRDIQALAMPQRPARRAHDLTLSMDEIILICFGVFAIVLAMES